MNAPIRPDDDAAASASSTILHQVIHTDDLDAALGTLQNVLGIKSGGVAALHCQKNGVIADTWKEMSKSKRIDFITDYIAVETAYSQ